MAVPAWRRTLTVVLATYNDLSLVQSGGADDVNREFAAAGVEVALLQGTRLRAGPAGEADGASKWKGSCYDI